VGQSKDWGNQSFIEEFLKAIVETIDTSAGTLDAYSEANFSAD
jgi:hypothetical protein